MGADFAVPSRIQKQLQLRSSVTPRLVLVLEENYPCISVTRKFSGYRLVVQPLRKIVLHDACLGRIHKRLRCQNYLLSSQGRRYERHLASLKRTRDFCYLQGHGCATGGLESYIDDNELLI